MVVVEGQEGMVMLLSFGTYHFLPFQRIFFGPFLRRLWLSAGLPPLTSDLCSAIYTSPLLRRIQIWTHKSLSLCG